jgi:hypothetical protein
MALKISPVPTLLYTAHYRNVSLLCWTLQLVAGIEKINRGNEEGKNEEKEG